MFDQWIPYQHSVDYLCKMRFNQRTTEVTTLFELPQQFRYHPFLSDSLAAANFEIIAK